jgi:hypothetical protein
LFLQKICLPQQHGGFCASNSKHSSAVLFAFDSQILGQRRIIIIIIIIIITVEQGNNVMKGTEHFVSL